MKITSKGHTVTFEQDDFEDIYDIACYGGIAYWCLAADINEDGDVAHFTDMEDDNKEYTVTKDKMEEVYGKILDGEYRMADYIREYFRSGDLGDIDSTAADVIVQICCFGEIVYG